MTIREAIRQQRQAAKKMRPRERLAYFWEYYGIKVICLLVALVTAVSFMISLVSKKDDACYAVFFGATAQASSGDFLQTFAETAQIDTDRYSITVQPSMDICLDVQITEEIYDSMQQFATLVAAQMVDVYAANTDLFLYYGYLGYATDLRKHLTDEQLSTLAPCLHYIDGELLRQQENSDGGLVFAYGQCPDSQKPEAMSDPIPIGIDISAATALFQDSYSFSASQTLLGLCAGTERPETALAFFQFILGIA